MKIRTKLWITIGIAVAIAGLVGTVLMTTFTNVHETMQKIRHTDGLVRSVFELKIATIDRQKDVAKRTRAQWEAKHASLRNDLNSFAAGSEEQIFIIHRMRQNHSSLSRSYAALFELYESATSEEGNKAIDAMERRLTARMDVCLLSMISDANQLLDSLSRELVEGQKTAIAIVAVSSVTMVVLIFCVAVMVHRTIIRPLLKLAKSAAIVGDGNLVHRTGMTSTDEVGQLSRAFDAMLDRLSAVMASRDALNSEMAQRKRAEDTLRKTLATLERSNQDLEQFAYSASHDLQEPLRKVMAFGSLLENEYGDKLAEEGRQYLRTMLNATQRMQTLIRDLLTYSRVSTRSNPFIPVDMNEIVKGVLSDLETRIAETGAEVDVQSLPTIDADPAQMRQLLQNLIGNALKFHKNYAQPHVRVYAEMPVAEDAGTSAPPKICRIVVEDDGIGFDEQYADRIFGLFQRLHQRDVYSGSGIGLAVCRRIGERHGGTIIAKSTPGKGARFVVTLPLKHA